mmetsp:Transcript_12285/g.21296  ORF Transcript_12285/g.21296 Transcript_12285/m.21296 type:complete len:121 (+) Transcript_12285:203-565(+)
MDWRGFGHVRRTDENKRNNHGNNEGDTEGGAGTSSGFGWRTRRVYGSCHGHHVFVIFAIYFATIVHVTDALFNTYNSCSRRIGSHIRCWKRAEIVGMAPVYPSAMLAIFVMFVTNESITV